jgi:hypothetical protein
MVQEERFISTLPWVIMYFFVCLSCLVVFAYCNFASTLNDNLFYCLAVYDAFRFTALLYHSFIHFLMPCFASLRLFMHPILACRIYTLFIFFSKYGRASLFCTAKSDAEQLKEAEEDDDMD